MDNLVQALAPIILGHLPIGVTVIDPETYAIIAQNDVITKTFGQCVARPCFSALMNRSTQCPACELPQALASGEARSTILTASNGVPVLVNWIPLLQGTKRLVIETLIAFPAPTAAPPSPDLHGPPDDSPSRPGGER